jgi:phage gpG-like protein
VFAFSVEQIPSSRIVGASFGAIARGFRTYRVPLTESVRQVGVKAIDENFRVGGRPPWEPHAEETSIRRDREGTLGREPQDILIESGRLWGDAVRLARWTITGDEAYISNLPGRSWYGVLHQTGTRHMPARPWGEMTTEDVDKIEDVFGKWRDKVILANLWRVRSLI